MTNALLPKHNWQIVARDYNSPFLRNYIWVGATGKFPSLLNITRPVIGIVSRKNTIEYIADVSTWQAAHDGIKAHVRKDIYFVEKLIEQTNAFGEAFNEWSEKNILLAHLANADVDTLVHLLKEFAHRQSILYTYGVAMPILDFQKFSFVEGNLKNILKEKTKSEEEYNHYYEVFTAPAHPSFAEEQEESLLELMAKSYSEQWRVEVLKYPLSKLKDLYPDFYACLQEHTKKYAWVYYVYAGPAYTEQNFFEFIKDHLHKGVDPSKRLVDIAKKQKRIAEEKQQLLSSLRLNEFETMILRLTATLVWAKPRRKDYQSKSYYHLEKLLKEISRRLFLSLSQVRSTPFDILEKGLGGGEIDVNQINSIYDFHVCLPDDSGESVVVTYGEEAQRFYDAFVEQEKAEKIIDRDIVRGTPAFRGKAKGKVKIVNTAMEMSKMEYGDILVSVATTPAIVPAMKKAAAIVTDEGGLTCHAAIVSRELEIPCIVGTNFGTRVLKGGDLVEVDANKGIVKKL